MNIEKLKQKNGCDIYTLNIKKGKDSDEVVTIYLKEITTRLEYTSIQNIIDRGDELDAAESMLHQLNAVGPEQESVIKEVCANVRMLISASKTLGALFDFEEAKIKKN